jgi:hypothetical protein
MVQVRIVEALAGADTGRGGGVVVVVSMVFYGLDAVNLVFGFTKIKRVE